MYDVNRQDKSRLHHIQVDRGFRVFTVTQRLYLHLVWLLSSSIVSLQFDLLHLSHIWDLPARLHQLITYKPLCKQAPSEQAT